MRVRAVDTNGDMKFGGDQASILRNSPDAVGQVVESRLNLWQGQWWLDLLEGTPFEQEVLGRRTENLRDPALQARILDTPGVASIDSFSSTFDANQRGYSVAAKITTVYSAAYQASVASNQTSINVKVEDGR